MYYYQAITDEETEKGTEKGQPRSGRIEAESLAEAIAALQAQGLTVLSIRQEKTGTVTTVPLHKDLVL